MPSSTSPLRSNASWRAPTKRKATVAPTRSLVMGAPEPSTSPAVSTFTAVSTIRPRTLKHQLSTSSLRGILARNEEAEVAGSLKKTRVDDVIESAAEEQSTSVVPSASPNVYPEAGTVSQAPSGSTMAALPRPEQRDVATSASSSPNAPDPVESAPRDRSNELHDTSSPSLSFAGEKTSTTPQKTRTSLGWLSLKRAVAKADSGKQKVQTVSEDVGEAREPEHPAAAGNAAPMSSASAKVDAPMFGPSPTTSAPKPTPAATLAKSTTPLSSPPTATSTNIPPLREPTSAPAPAPAATLSPIPIPPKQTPAIPSQATPNSTPTSTRSWFGTIRKPATRSKQSLVDSSHSEPIANAPVIDLQPDPKAEPNMSLASAQPIVVLLPPTAEAEPALESHVAVTPPTPTDAAPPSIPLVADPELAATVKYSPPKQPSKGWFGFGRSTVDLTLTAPSGPEAEAAPASPKAPPSPSTRPRAGSDPVPPTPSASTASDTKWKGESVVSLPLSPETAQTQKDTAPSSAPTTPARKPANAGANDEPAPSRGSLFALPLLGRAKPKLVDVKPKETEAVAADPPATKPQEGKANVEVEDTQKRVEEADESTKSLEAVKSDGNVAEEGKSGHNVDATGSSWWGYIGLGGGSATSSTPAQQDNEGEAKPPADSSDSVVSSTEGGSVTPTGKPVPPPLNIDTKSTSMELILSPRSQNSPSIRSGSSTTAAQGPWINPWTWYSTPAAPTTPPPSSPTAGKTEAELVKEEALARPASPARAPSSPENPIMTHATHSSWVSFFTRSSITSAFPVRTITAGNAGDGSKGEMEVMDIDDYDPQTAAPILVASSGSPPKPSSVPKPTNSELPKKSDPPTERPTSAPVPPLTDSTSTKNKATPATGRASPRVPNFVLPSFGDTFFAPPRSLPPPISPFTLKGTIKLVNSLIWTPPPVSPEFVEYQQERERRKVDPKDKGKGKRSIYRLQPEGDAGANLPRMWGVLGEPDFGDLVGVKRVVVIGIHGWFPGAIMRTMFGEPTGTSTKFAAMMESAVLRYAAKHNISLEKVTKMELEGEGTIDKRVERLMQHYLSRSDWIEDLQRADAILVATHSQGSVVSTQLLDRLMTDGHIRTATNQEAVTRATAGIEAPRAVPPHKVCCLALCGIHLGPFLYLNASSILQPYLQYLEAPQARELFEFQDTESAVSKTYVSALGRVLSHGTKFVYLASLNDQVVPIYSGVFTSVSHPLILRALYMDGDAYSSSDFLSNLIVLLLRIRNAGLDDSGLLTHISEATAGSLSGVGHSSAYEEPASYDLAVRFLFETSGVVGENPTMISEPFSARAARNDYMIPWALRGLIEDPQVSSLFSAEINELRRGFDLWVPRTATLKDMRRKLEPIRTSPLRRSTTIDDAGDAKTQTSKL